MFRRSLPFIRSFRTAYATGSLARMSSNALPDLLPFLEKHATTQPELHLRDVLRSKANDDPLAWKGQAKQAYIDATYYDYALELEEDEYERGRLYMRANQPNAAKQCYDRAIKASPNYPRILISLAAWEYHQRQDYDKALQYLDRAMNSTKPDKDSTLRLEILKYQGLMHRSKGDFQEALSIYTTAMDSGATECRLDIADMHAALEDWKAARDQYLNILNDKPDDDAIRAVLLHNLARCHAQVDFFRHDNGDAAIEYCEKSLTLKRSLGADSSEVAKTVTLMGVVYAKQNDKAKALRRFQEALILARSSGDSENELVMYALRNIAVLKGQKVPKWSG